MSADTRMEAVGHLHQLGGVQLVTLEDGADATIIGLNDTIVAGAHANITLIGNGDSLTVNGIGTSVDVAGNNETVSMSHGTLTVELGSTVAVTGTDNQVGQGSAQGL